MALRASEMDRQYGRPTMHEDVERAMLAVGKQPDRLTTDDLAPLDQFHACGRAATEALATLAGVVPTMCVLDIGGGIGGPARVLAERGCQVVSIEPSACFRDLSTWFNRATGLEERIEVRDGDGTALDLDDETFDLVWLQHMTMNVERLDLLFNESYRVLRPGGTLALHEIGAGPQAPPDYPLPWADTPAFSHLVSPMQLRTLAEQAGFSAQHWADQTAETTRWLEDMLERLNAAADMPTWGLPLVLGPSLPRKFRNLLSGLQQDQLRVTAAVFVSAGQT